MCSPALAPGQGAFAFTGSGLLLPYYLGIMYTLNATGYITPGVTPTAGLSGGALTTFAACAGITMPQLSQHLKEALAAYPLNFWPVRPNILLGLANISDPQTFARCSGKVRAAISRLDRSSPILNASASWLVDSFASNTDYWGAVAASSTISCATSDPQANPANGGPSFWEYRGHPSMDGAYANDITHLCASLGQPYGTPGSTCVSIESYEPGVFREGGVQSSAAPAGGSSATTNGTANSNLQISFTTTLDGRRMLRAVPEGSLTLLPTNCSAFPNGVGLPPFKPPFDPAGPWPSICPGCDPRNPLPYTLEQWQDMSMNGAVAMAEWEAVYQYGSRDAALWVANQTQALREQERQRPRGRLSLGGAAEAVRSGAWMVIVSVLLAAVVAIAM